MSERLTLPVKETRRVSEWQVPHVKATRRVSKDMQYHCITVNCSQINPTIKPANQARQANTTRERVVSPARQGNPPHKQRTCSITADQLVSTHTCHITKAIHAFNRSSDTHPLLTQRATWISTISSEKVNHRQITCTQYVMTL